MSTNVKMVGYYCKFKNKKKAIEAYKLLGKKVIDSDDFIDDNYDELFSYDMEDNLNKWIPYYDYDNTFGVIYLIDYEYDAFNLCASFSEKSPKFEGMKSKPFAVLFYNGSDNPLIMK